MMNDDTVGLRFSEDALSNRTIFFSNLNDINIFIEDVGKEYEYEEIFERLFENEITIYSIFPLGGKDAVLREFSQKGSHDSSGKVNIYIVDGDFDNLWDDQKVLSPYLIYLSRYNIESYYCSKNAVLRFMRSYLRCPRSAVEERINFDEWRNTVCREIGELFVLFAIIKRYCPELPNVRLGIGRFIDKNGCLVNIERLSYLEEIRAKLGNVDELIDEMNNMILVKFGEENSDGIFSIVCGKYQFESLCRNLKRCCGRNINREQFKNYLISNFDLTPLLFLKEHILQLFYDPTLAANSAS